MLKFMSSILKCVSTVHIIKACTLHLFLQRYTLVKVHLKTKHLKKIMVCSGKFIITTFFKDKNIYFFLFGCDFLGSQMCAARVSAALTEIGPCL